MGYLKQIDDENWVIQRQRSSVQIPLIPGKYYLIDNGKNKFNTLFKFLSVETNIHHKPRIYTEEVYYSDGEKSLIHNYMITHHSCLENTILAPQEMTHLDLLLLHT